MMHLPSIIQPFSARYFRYPVEGRRPVKICLFLLTTLLVGVWPTSTALAQEYKKPEPTAEKVIYLTFDDGPSPYTQPILDLLAEYDAKATFFVIGRAAARHPELIEAISEAGHGLGNHTYSHPFLPKVSRQWMAYEVFNTSAAIGGRDNGCLRPPYGAYTSTVAKNAEGWGYQLVLWTIDPRDWARPGARAIAHHVIGRAHPDGVVVLHDGGGDRSQTVAALEIILPALRKQGYRFAAMCRDGVAPPVLKQAPPPMPLYATPVLDAPKRQNPVQARNPDAQINVEIETIEADNLDEGAPAALSPSAILNPQAGAVVSGETMVIAVADHPTFRKWQLDLLLDGERETFLAVGEHPASAPTELFRWDTTRYPDGAHLLRLRVVYAGMNYEEHFQPIIIANLASSGE